MTATDTGYVSMLDNGAGATASGAIPARPASITGGRLPRSMRAGATGNTKGGGRRLRLPFTAAAIILLAGVFTGAATATAATPHSAGAAINPRAVSPPARSGAAMAYDPATGQLVLFGGTGAKGLLGDTWTYTGTAWVHLHPTTSPTARSGASMAYDPATRRLVLFGGLGAVGLMADTWSWNGSNWIFTPPPPIARSSAAPHQIIQFVPPARQGATLAYDGATGQMLLFGGFGTTGLLADTWIFRGAYWTHLTPKKSPPARAFATMSYDGATAQLVLFGGQGPICCPVCVVSGSHGAQSTIPCVCPLAAIISCSGALSDTWVWSGDNWVQLHPKTSPSARSRAVMSYDAATGKVVLFGGQNPNCCPVCAKAILCIHCTPAIVNCPNGPRSDTWNWNGSNWVLLKPATSPPARSSAVMADFSPIRKLVLFGGSGLTQTGLPQIFGDTWSWNGRTWAKR